MKRFVIFGVLVLAFLNNSAQAARVVLDNVPQYDHLWKPYPEWVNGCTARAAGSLMAYWDSQPGFGNLYKSGDAQIWSGDVTTGTRRMVASQRYSNNDLDPPDCLASFLGTDVGGTPTINIRPGLEGFAEWDDTSAYDMKDAYQANTSYHNVYGASTYLSDHFDFLKSEIDAGRPVFMTVQGRNTSHSVLAYGYDDDITFNLYDNMEVDWFTAPAFAVMDTWVDNTANGSRWWTWEDHGSGWELTAVEEIFNGGHEWWPFYPWNNLYMGGDDAHMEWQLSAMYTFELVPEPTTILLFALGGLMLRKRKA